MKVRKIQLKLSTTLLAVVFFAGLLDGFGPAQAASGNAGSRASTPIVIFLGNSIVGNMSDNNRHQHFRTVDQTLNFVYECSTLIGWQVSRNRKGECFLGRGGRRLLRLLGRLKRRYPDAVFSIIAAPPGSTLRPLTSKTQYRESGRDLAFRYNYLYNRLTREGFNIEKVYVMSQLPLQPNHRYARANEIVSNSSRHRNSEGFRSPRKSRNFNAALKSAVRRNRNIAYIELFDNVDRWASRFRTMDGGSQTARTATDMFNHIMASVSRD
jgi:hypothetical protein